MPFHSTKPKRLARSVKEIRRRQLGDEYQSIFDRCFYMVLSGLLFGVLGLLLDGVISVVCAIFSLSNGDMIWLFTPLLIIFGAITGLYFGKRSGAMAMEMFFIRPKRQDDDTITPEIFRGVGIAILIFAFILLFMMLRQ